MSSVKKFLPAVVVVALGALLAVFVLRMEKQKVADAHDHGHGKEEAGDHAGHGEEGGEGKAGHEDHGHEEGGHEGHGQRIVIDPEGIRNADLGFDTVQAAEIRKSLPLSGHVQANQDKLARMMPRFAGVVKEVRYHLGAKVTKGAVLAVIESNESLAPYSVIAQVGGTVIQKNVNPGEVVAEGDILYTVADLSTVWIDLNVHRQDFARLKVGQEVMVRLDKESPYAKSRIAYLSPLGAENTQTMLARLIVANPDGFWRPGLFVDGLVTLATEEVPLAVSEEAIQMLNGKEVVFVKEDEAFEAREIEVGLRDGIKAEVVSGLAPGDVYCSRNSFILKAEVGKSEAKHEH